MSLGLSSPMQEALQAIQAWSTTKKVRINPKKTKDMWICFNTTIPEPAPLVTSSEVVEIAGGLASKVEPSC